MVWIVSLIAILILIISAIIIRIIIIKERTEMAHPCEAGDASASSRPASNTQCYERAYRGTIKIEAVNIIVCNMRTHKPAGVDERTPLLPVFLLQKVYSFKNFLVY